MKEPKVSLQVKEAEKMKEEYLKMEIKTHACQDVYMNICMLALRLTKGDYKPLYSISRNFG